MLRSILAIALAALVPTAAVARDCPEGQRPFQHAAGVDCIPETPQRIVTLQDQNALLPLMELGVRPVASAGHVNAEGERVFRRMEGYDTAGIRWIGSYREPDREAVAAVKPDLIIASPAHAHELFSPIAPTVVIDTLEQPLENALLQFAEAVNRTDRAEDLRDRLEDKADALRAQLRPALEETTVSVIAREYQGSGFYGVEPTHAFGAARRLLKPTMTSAEADWGSGREAKSLEMLGDHPADVMFFMTFDADEGTDSAQFEDFRAEPLVRALPVVRAGQLYRLDGSAMVGSAWGKIENGLDQMARVLTREDLDRNLVQE
ncbi:ABC transporter substrate-binding protein [Caenispirillum salinarum]|uniref:ABC transporter substrate-binding protein n=1 Tax=Caenispirillum salinarum TaxID=859058 RepID=UPI00384CA75A